MRRAATTLLLLAYLVSCRSGQTPPADGELLVLTYNVAGIPQFFSKTNSEVSIPLIGARLDRYDLVLVQEDFYYHDALVADVDLPYQSTPSRLERDLADMGDGLNRFSILPFRDHLRTRWLECHGEMSCGYDCYGSKGYSVAQTELPGGPRLDVWNLHMEAGSCAGDYRVRATNIAQLVADIQELSNGAAVIVAGDTNLHAHRPKDLEQLHRLMSGTGLTDACQALKCGDERLDRVLFRSSDSVLLTPVEWYIPDEFVGPSGEDLSDHKPVAVRFRWERM
ncbi:MAG: hypothetical protein ABI333_22660 [bacterium]